MMTVPALLIPAFLKTGLDFDVDAVAVLKQQGIDPLAISMETGRVLADRFGAALDELARLTQNPAIGLSFVHHFSYDYVPEVESFLMSTAKLAEATEAYRWMTKLFEPLVTVYFDDAETLFTIRLEMMPGTPESIARLFAECSFSLVSRLAMQKLGRELNYRKVVFGHSNTEALPVYKNYFRCPVSLNAGYYALSVSQKDWQQPFEQHSPALKALSRMQVEQRIAQMVGEKTIGESIEDLLLQHPYLMAGGIAECATRLYLSQRTLQRRLKTEGTSYRMVCEKVRRTLAKQLLEGRSSLEQISDLLCFADRRSFTRAFQEWEGMTPSTYRKGLEDRNNTGGRVKTL